jgi:hypothetical protein
MEQKYAGRLILKTYINVSSKILLVFKNVDIHMSLIIADEHKTIIHTFLIH